MQPRHKAQSTKHKAQSTRQREQGTTHNARRTTHQTKSNRKQKPAQKQKHKTQTQSTQHNERGTKRKSTTKTRANTRTHTRSTQHIHTAPITKHDIIEHTVSSIDLHSTLALPACVVVCHKGVCRVPHVRVHEHVLMCASPTCVGVCVCSCAGALGP